MSPRQVLAELPWLALVGLVLGLGTGFVLDWLPGDGVIQAGKSCDWDWHLAEVEAAAIQWRHGWLPVWNPWTAGGIPLLSSPETPVFYPLSWLAAVIGSVPAVRVGLVVHLMLLAIGVGALTRVLGGSRWAALVAVIGLATSDFLMVRVAHGHFIHLTIAWLPFGLLGVAGRWRPELAGLLGGVAIAAPALGGGPYPTWMAWTCFVGLCFTRMLAGRGVLGPLSALLGAWILTAGAPVWIAGPVGLGIAGVVWWWERRDRPATEPVLPVLKTLLWGGLFTALLAAPKVLVMTAAIHDSPRLARGVGFEPLIGLSFGAMEVFTSIFLHSDEHLRLGGLGGAHESLPRWYTPLFGLLAVAGIAASRRVQPGFVALALAMVGLSFGVNLPVDLFSSYTALPGFDRFNEPQRWGMVWVPLLSVLAGLGVDAISRRGPKVVLAPLLAFLLVAHLGYGMLSLRARGRIGWPQGGEYTRVEPGPPTAVMGGLMGAFESIRHNVDCLDCGDPLGQSAPPELFPLRDDVLVIPNAGWELSPVRRRGHEGVMFDGQSASRPWGIEPPVASFTWSPAQVTFVAEHGGAHALPIAARRGWEAHTAQGMPLELAPVTPAVLELRGSAPLLVVHGVTPGMQVVVRYRAPGLRLALGLFVIGLGLALRALVRLREDVPVLDADEQGPAQ